MDSILNYSDFEKGNYKNQNDLIAIKLNRISVGSFGFNVYFNIYNLSKDIISININSAYFITSEKEQIYSIFDSKHILNSQMQNKIVGGLHIQRMFRFPNNRTMFESTDIFIVSLSLNFGDQIIFSESCDNLLSKEIIWE